MKGEEGTVLSGFQLMQLTPSLPRGFPLTSKIVWVSGRKGLREIVF